MTVRESGINRIVKSYDKDLFVAPDYKGTLCVWRHKPRYESFDFEGTTYVYSLDDRTFVFALTDSWNQKGNPVEWGLEVILARLKALDMWRSPEFIESVIREQELDKERGKRQIKNNVESFLIDFRRQFAKSFEGINTSTMDKTDRRQLKGV